MNNENQQPLATFAEIEALFKNLPEGDRESADAAEKLLPEHCGTLGDYAVWLAEWQGKVSPQLRHARIALFSATYAADPKLEETRALIQQSVEGKLLLNKMSAAVDCDLRVYEMDLEQPCQLPMREEDCARAIAYGMMAVEPGVQLLCISDLSPGAPLDTEWAENDASPLEILRQKGGYDSAAAVGAILAARLAHVPVVLSGAPALLAFGLLFQHDENLVLHCLPLDEEEGFATEEQRCWGAEIIATLRLAAGLLA